MRHILLRNRNRNRNSYLRKLRLLNFNRPYPFFKPVYNSIIPLDIYQTWVTKDLPEKMQLQVERLKRRNPKFKHHLFDDNDCYEFIKNNFDRSVLNAYNRLIPGAYKADLWRYCVLYKKGGIYLDIKLKCINNFRLIELTEREHFVKDRWDIGIYNALMACKAGNELLLKAINRIVENVNNNFYGICPLHPTGPRLLKDLINETGMNVANVDMMHKSEINGVISYRRTFVLLTSYPEYHNEQNDSYNKINKSRYDKLWAERRIYA